MYVGWWCAFIETYMLWVIGILECAKQLVKDETSTDTSSERCNDFNTYSVLIPLQLCVVV